jgi:RimJ/RimL family protein N-acetyltransferase
MALDLLEPPRGGVHFGLNRVWGVFLPNDARSHAVAERLGLRLTEERILSHYPDKTHVIWWVAAEELRSR